MELQKVLQPEQEPAQWPMEQKTIACTQWPEEQVLPAPKPAATTNLGLLLVGLESMAGGPESLEGLAVLVEDATACAMVFPIQTIRQGRGGILPDPIRCSLRTRQAMPLWAVMSCPPGLVVSVIQKPSPSFSTVNGPSASFASPLTNGQAWLGHAWNWGWLGLHVFGFLKLLRLNLYP
ncbi:hypothetical protein K432DRAFT_385896 [Lepidopterella palustris CBS 459.81]|uniref:Uncharacterized protein n=1 Tax=Lepidopterella palustris CBS 459.81 TaxID=1314670 RepID=A0A8E2JBF9_9PEZI|nr:hypothetical protein K432DRAFT_385896 [Lepidopterella palustris CBS 459.81]